MLTDADVDFMNETSDEIKTKRKREITVFYLTGVKDPITGELDEAEDSRIVEAVVTEISAYGSADRSLDNGVVYEKGDIQLSVKIGLIEDIARILKQIEYDGRRYEIIAMDKKGIGKRNRYEMIARVIT